MSRIKTDNCQHAYYRAAERCGWTKREAKLMMLNASKNGKTYSQVDDVKLAEFMKARQVGTQRRIKFYLGFIFVFASTSTRCYTVYKYEGDKTNESD